MSQDSVHKILQLKGVNAEEHLEMAKGRLTELDSIMTRRNRVKEIQYESSRKYVGQPQLMQQAVEKIESSIPEIDF